jgi:hypothetical protein
MQDTVRSIASSLSEPVFVSPAPRRVDRTIRSRVLPELSVINKFVELLPISIAAKIESIDIAP